MNETPKKKILIVDDDEDTQDLVGMALESVGYEVQVVDNGEQAVATVQNNTYDLIILDVMMPIMDGIRFLHWFREELKCATPVMILTGMAATDIESEAYAAGATAVELKPRSIKELRNKVTSLLQ